MVLTRLDKPVVFDQPTHVIRERHIFDALLPLLPNVQGKRVLDLGCGWGFFGRQCAERGADVTFVDGRSENLAVAKEKAPGHAYVLQDVMSPYWSPAPADLSLCLGVLYHVEDPMTLLQKAACAPILVVETICLDHDGIALVTMQEDTAQLDYSLTGGACRPSPGWVEKALYDIGYTDVYDLHVCDVPATDGWAGEVWQWEYERTCGWRREECHLRKLYLATR